jgi:hypothetical protein
MKKQRQSPGIGSIARRLIFVILGEFRSFNRGSFRAIFSSSSFKWNYRLHILVVFLCLFLYSCSTPCREWIYEENPATSPCYASSQLSLSGSSTNCPLRVLLVRTISGIRMYVDLLQLQVPPDPSDCSKALIIITTNDKTYPIFAYRFEGCQRMLIPSEAADELIDLLLNGHSFTIQIGSYQSDVIPINFEKHRIMLQ